MDKNKQVLLVTNTLSDEEAIEISQALSRKDASKLAIKLNLVHAVPRLPTCYFNLPSMGMLIEKYHDEAKQSLTQIGKLLGVSQKNQWLISGPIRTGVLGLASKLNSDFILTSSEQHQELQRSLFFKNVKQLSIVKSISQLKQL